MNSLRTILHPTDFSDLSQLALQRAYALARDKGGRLIILHVQEPPEVIEGEFGMLPADPQPDDETLMADLQRQVPAAAPIDVECMLAHGVVAEQIVHAAKDVSADLIVMATHGQRNILTRLFHANIAQAVRKDAPCEVMTVESVPTGQAPSAILD